MRPLAHEAAHERLMDIVLEPDVLDELAVAVEGAQGSRRGDAEPFVAHVAACAQCQVTVRSWQGTHHAVRDAGSHAANPSAAAASGAHAEAEDPSDPDRLTIAAMSGERTLMVPVAVRATLLNTIRSVDFDGTRPIADVASNGPLPAATRPPRRAPGARTQRLFAFAAVLAIVAVGVGVTIDRSARLDQAQHETARLATVAATVDRLLQDPSHHVVALTRPDGTIQGSISWSSQEFVVLTSALTPSSDGRVYRCWIERDGVRAAVGAMEFAGGTAFWIGSLDDWATTSFGRGTFGVSLESAAGSLGGVPVLVAALGT